MTKTIETIFSIQKDKEYKSAIKDINSSLSVLKSEMKAATAEFRDNEGSMEALTAKGDILERTLLTQKEKVQELENALKNAANIYGESDSRTKSYAVQLNNARAAVADTEAAIRQNTEAMEEQRDATADVSEGFAKSTTTVRDFISELGINLPPIADKALGKFGDLSIGGVGAMGAIVAAGKKAVDVVKELAEQTKKSAAKVDDLLTESKKSGIDTYTLQVLHYMEDLADVDVSTVTDAMADLTRKMGEAAGGSKTALEAFDTFGIRITENGHLRNATDVFFDIVDALHEIPNETERNAAAIEFFGDKAKDLNTLISDGTEDLRKYEKEANNIGYILSDQEQNVLDVYNDSLDRINKQQEALADQLSLQLAPGLNSLTKSLQNLKTSAQWFVIDSGIVDFISRIGEKIGMVVDWFSIFADSINALIHIGEDIPEHLVNTYPALAAIQADRDSKKGSYHGYTAETGKLSGILYGLTFPGFAAGVDNWRGGMAWVGEAGPELVSLPRGSSVLSAQESRNLGGDTIIINAQIDSLGTLQEIIGWYQNRQRIERMG